MNKCIQEERQPAVDAWINLLKIGGTKSSVELAKLPSVDITTGQPLKDTVAYEGKLVDQLEEFIKDIENN